MFAAQAPADAQDARRLCFLTRSQISSAPTIGATAEYYFNPMVSAYARYEHTDFTTDSTRISSRMSLRSA
jgi:hypothetical protein